MRDSSAMLMPAYAMQRPHKLVVGGPAAGTVASAHFGAHLDLHDILCVDVGARRATSAWCSTVHLGERHLRAQVGPRGHALSTEIVTRVRGADRSCRSDPRATSVSGPTARAPTPVRLLRQGRHRTDDHRRRALDRHPCSRSLRRRQGAAPSPGADAFRCARHFDRPLRSASASSGSSACTTSPRGSSTSPSGAGSTCVTSG